MDCCNMDTPQRISGHECVVGVLIIGTLFWRYPIHKCSLIHSNNYRKILCQNCGWAIDTGKYVTEKSIILPIFWIVVWPLKGSRFKPVARREAIYKFDWWPFWVYRCRAKNTWKVPCNDKTSYFISMNK